VILTDKVSGDTYESPRAYRKRVGISEAKFCCIQDITRQHIGDLIIGYAL
jgi:hypothetical protein